MVTAILVLELGGGKFFLLEITPCQDLLHPCKGGNQLGNRTLPLPWLPVKTVTFFISIHPSVTDAVSFNGPKFLILILLIYLLYRPVTKIVLLNETT